MGRSEAKAFGLEGEAANRRRRAPGLDRPGFIARANLLAGAPGASLAAQRQGVDPSALLVADLLKSAVGADSDDAPVVAPGQQRLAVADRCQRRGVGVDHDALLLIGVADEDNPVSERQRRRAVDERRRHDMRARGESLRMFGERSVRRGVGHGSERAIKPRRPGSRCGYPLP